LRKTRDGSISFEMPPTVHRLFRVRIMNKSFACMNKVRKENILHTYRYDHKRYYYNNLSWLFRVGDTGIQGKGQVMSHRVIDKKRAEMCVILVILCIFATCSGYMVPNMCLATNNKVPPELKSCLTREYGSFFSPFEKDFYSTDVEFTDPLNKFSGRDKYQENVDMLGGRTGLGSFLFKDAAITLYDVTALPDGRVQTRWALRVTVKALPWQPTPRFSGVSLYTLGTDGKVVKQEDFWDSINLTAGRYSPVGFLDGLRDFLGQLQQDNTAEMVAPELPYELLRRGKEYEVRRYPAHVVAETTYDQRPEGYDRIGNYVQGSNEKNERIAYFSPTLMTISESKTTGKRAKKMVWPIAFAAPGQAPPPISSFPTPSVSKIRVREVPECVYAVVRFEMPATEPVVRGFTGNLIKYVTDDGMVVASSAREGDCRIGQYDALFSLNKRRNEAWVELAEHPWL